MLVEIAAAEIRENLAVHRRIHDAAPRGSHSATPGFGHIIAVDRFTPLLHTCTTVGFATEKAAKFLQEKNVINNRIAGSYFHFDFPLSAPIKFLREPIGLNNRRDCTGYRKQRPYHRGSTDRQICCYL